MPRFKEMPHEPSQIWLMPPSLDEMVSKDEEVRVLSEAMDRLDWTILERTYFEREHPCLSSESDDEDSSLRLLEGDTQQQKDRGVAG